MTEQLAKVVGAKMETVEKLSAVDADSETNCSLFAVESACVLVVNLTVFVVYLSFDSLQLYVNQVDTHLMDCFRTRLESIYLAI